MSSFEDAETLNCRVYRRRLPLGLTNQSRRPGGHSRNRYRDIIIDLMPDRRSHLNGESERWRTILTSAEETARLATRNYFVAARPGVDYFFSPRGRIRLLLILPPAVTSKFGFYDLACYVGAITQLPPSRRSVARTSVLGGRGKQQQKNAFPSLG